MREIDLNRMKAGDTIHPTTGPISSYEYINHLDGKVKIMDINTNKIHEVSYDEVFIYKEYCDDIITEDESKRNRLKQNATLFMASLINSVDPINQTLNRPDLVAIQALNAAIAMEDIYDKIDNDSSIDEEKV